jgi:agmatine deiminase
MIFCAVYSEDLEKKPIPAWKTKNYQRNLMDYRFLPILTPPPSGKTIYTPAEFAPMEGVLIQVPTDWPQVNTYYAEMIKAIIAADATPYIIADSTNGFSGNDITSITNNILKPNGIDPNDVEFLDYDYDANWTRDYGPWDIYVDGVRAIVNHEYYDDRKKDNAINGKLATLWNEEMFSTGLHTEGGNFMTDGLGTCWASTGVIFENVGYYSWTKAEIDAVYVDYLNCSNGIHYPEPLPNEETTHIDMFSKILDQNTIIVSYSTLELGGSAAEIAALDAAAEFYANTPKPDGGKWNIVRIPMTFGDYSAYGETWRVQYTHTNSTIVNDHVIVPVYGRGTDEEAMKIYAELMPRHTLIGVDSNNMIIWGGSIHCTTMQLPVKTYSKCGNGVVDEDEECDTYFTNGIECKDLTGFNSGLLRCKNDCTFDISLCIETEEPDESEIPDHEIPDETSLDDDQPVNPVKKKETGCTVVIF